ncbi:MAG: hypothetical protein U5J99_05365 [Parvularculaceae bacterium]|nr:hypothetical protein [Parvularculaceae bacterium]
MVSPHPSYPPLEMASAGMQVVANAYEGKDLSLRAPNIRSVYGLNPQALAAKIGEAVIAASPGRIVAPVSVGAPHSVAPTLRWRDVVDSIW